MELKVKKNEVIFRQGDPSDCMYRIEDGRVGIFLDYGTANQTKLAELKPKLIDLKHIRYNYEILERDTAPIDHHNDRRREKER